MNNLLGFKKATDPIPPCAKTGVKIGKYDSLIKRVNTTGDTYCFDTKDKQKASSLSIYIGRRVKTLGISDVKVKVRGTVVYVVKGESDD